MDETKDTSIRESLRASLREATRAEHVALDERFSALDLAVRQGYGTFLMVHLEALQRFRNVWREEDALDFQTMIRCLQLDLGVGASVHEYPSRPPLQRHPSNGLEFALGISYVVRGSRLGARLLRRRVPDAFPTRFLDYSTALPWPSFLEELESLAIETRPVTTEKLIRGAKMTFATYATILDWNLRHAQSCDAKHT